MASVKRVTSGMPVVPPSNRAPVKAVPAVTKTPVTNGWQPLSTKRSFEPPLFNGPQRTDHPVTLVVNAEAVQRDVQQWKVDQNKPVATWRGAPDSPVGKLIASWVQRLRASPAWATRIDGDNPETLLRRAILDNRAISNEQLFAMSKVRLDQLTLPPAGVAEVEKTVPNARQLPVHRFTVSMMAAVTGISESELSQQCPDLGLTGAPDTGVLYAAPGDRVQRSTALHDLTESMREAGIAGINTAVWGVEGKKASAAVSFIGGGSY